MMQKKSSAWAWFLVHIIFPLLPFVLECSIRLIVSNFTPRWDTFSGSTLAMSYGLLLVFIDQSLLNQISQSPLMNEDRIDEIKIWSNVLRSAVIFFYAPLFALCVGFEYLALFYPAIQAIAITLSECCDNIVVLSSVFVIPTSMIIRSIFKLRTVLA
jgi:hypothetical protein